MATQQSARSAQAFILITLLIDGIGAGVMMPVWPQLLVEVTGKSVTDAAIWGGWLLTCFSIVQFFSAPILGNLSDRYGRRPVLLGSLSALGLNYLLMGFAPSLSWLFVGQLIAGAFAATYGTAGAYIADVTTPDERAKHVGRINAVFAMGFTIGPLVGGLLAEYGVRTPFFVGTGLALLNVVYGFFLLPESLLPSNRRQFSLAKSNPIGALVHIHSQARGLPLLGALTLMQIAMLTIPVTWAYVTTVKFGWSRREIGASLGFYGALSIAVQGYLLGWLHRKWGNQRTAFAGFSFLIMGLLGFAFSNQSAVILLFIVPAMLGSLAGPPLVSHLSARMPATSQGELQGAVTLVASFSAVLTPPLMTQLFSHFSGSGAPFYFPSAPYLLAALLAAGGLSIALHAPHWTRSTLNRAEANG